MVKRTPELFEKIEGYLNDTLSEPQKKSFEKEILANSKLKNEVEKHRELHLQLKNFDVLDFRKKLLEIESQTKIKNVVSKGNLRYLKPAVATILLLIGLSLVWLFLNNSQKNLFEKYYQPYPIEDVTRGEQDDLSFEITKKYNESEYQEIVQHLEMLVRDFPKNDLFKLYLGNSYLNLNEEDKAISVFSDISQNIYKEEALWYTTLSYLKTNNIQNVKSEIDKVIQYDGIYKQNALELLDELKTKNPDDF